MNRIGSVIKYWYRRGNVWEVGKFGQSRSFLWRLVKVKGLILLKISKHLYGGSFLFPFLTHYVVFLFLLVFCYCLFSCCCCSLFYFLIFFKYPKLSILTFSAPNNWNLNLCFAFYKSILKDLFLNLNSQHTWIAFHQLKTSRTKCSCTCELPINCYVMQITTLSWNWLSLQMSVFLSCFTNVDFTCKKCRLNEISKTKQHGVLVFRVL